MKKKFYKVYCCFYGCSSKEVIVEEHTGELRLDKNHPRLYFERLKRSCIGFECLNKIMFATEKEAKKQAKILNDKKISGLEWEKWVLEMEDKTHWLTLQEFQELNLQELREDKDKSE